MDILLNVFVILPDISWGWMSLSKGTSYELRIAWLAWYVSFGNINYTLKKNGY